MSLPIQRKFSNVLIQSPVVTSFFVRSTAEENFESADERKQTRAKEFQKIQNRLLRPERSSPRN